MKKTAVQETEADISNDLRELVRDAEKLLAQSSDAADEKFTELRARMRDALDSSHDQLERAREYASDQAKRADEYVRTHPYHTLGIAAAIGLVIGALATRRS
jgi:ElaB/YqjD/DUF883 family membrane-anchored ribosome-binding protein